MGTKTKDDRVSAGAALLSRLRRHGVDYIFANSGTDFPPIIEGLAEADAKDMPLPKAVVMPFESAAVAMAHGYYLATGKPQAVMVHTNVGLANAILGTINASCDQVPMLLFGGRTPTLEKGRLGARTVPIGWGQEMMDQAALVREPCKWDYELRFPEQINDVVDRASGISQSTPKGPVYVSLPREVLCESVPAADGERRPQMQPSAAHPLAADIEAAARILAEAENPVIFAQRGGGGEAGFKAIQAIAEDWGIPVCQYWALRLALPTDHPMAAGPDPKPLLEKADAILVIDGLAPWAPDDLEPAEGCQVIQLGPDPLQSRTAVRNFRSDLSLVGETEPALLSLRAALDRKLAGAQKRNRARFDRNAKINSAGQDGRKAHAKGLRSAPQLTKAGVSSVLSDVLESEPATVFSELGCQLPFMTLREPLSWFDAPHSGGLGFSFPAALGFKLAAPERTVVATMGDGSYIFSNPVACHQIAEALGISIVVIVLNNREWGAVRRSVQQIYPAGYAMKANQVPLTSLEPSPNFVSVAHGSRAWARSVSSEEELERAIADALSHTKDQKGLALIEVAIAVD